MKIQPFFLNKYFPDCCKPLINFQSSEKVSFDLLVSLFFWRRVFLEILKSAFSQCECFTNVVLCTISSIAFQEVLPSLMPHTYFIPFFSSALATLSLLIFHINVRINLTGSKWSTGIFFGIELNHQFNFEKNWHIFHSQCSCP